ncbi:MAG: PilZ domain-containing protein [bacterium]
MKNSNFRERRKYVRFNIDARVNFKVKGTDKTKTSDKAIPGLVRNICVEGACFILDTRFAVNTILHLEIQLPSFSRAVHLTGEIRWSRPFMNQDVFNMFETGVKIIEIDKEDEIIFIDFLNKKMFERTARHPNS